VTRTATHLVILWNFRFGEILSQHEEKSILRDISMDSHNFLGVDPVKIPNKSLKLLRQKEGK
jgi:hypothetical protein